MFRGTILDGCFNLLLKQSMMWISSGSKQSYRQAVNPTTQLSITEYLITGISDQRMANLWPCTSSDRITFRHGLLQFSSPALSRWVGLRLILWQHTSAYHSASWHSLLQFSYLSAYPAFSRWVGPRLLFSGSVHLHIIVHPGMVYCSSPALPRPGTTTGVQWAIVSAHSHGG